MLKIYVGWDPLDILAYEKCVRSIKKHVSIKTDIQPLKDWELRRKGLYWRPYHVDEKGQKWDNRDGKPFSTNFSFTRFCVPALCDYRDEWVLFCDPDMLWRADPNELLGLVNQKYAVMCVKHQHVPKETEKMGGLMQTRYERKNWSSLMLMNPSRCKALTKYVVNNQSGSHLHGMLWLPDDQIGEFPEEYNWLEGWSSPDIEPKVIHHTRGTPDMPGCEDVAYAREWWEA